MSRLVNFSRLRQKGVKISFNIETEGHPIPKKRGDFCFLSYTENMKGVVLGATKGVVLGFVIDQLKSGTIPLETTWMDMSQKDPELVLNPKWMHRADHPAQVSWQVHYMAYRNRPERMTALEALLLKKTENIFLCLEIF